MTSRVEPKVTRMEKRVWQSQLAAGASKQLNSKMATHAQYIVNSTPPSDGHISSNRTTLGARNKYCDYEKCNEDGKLIHIA